MDCNVSHCSAIKPVVGGSCSVGVVVGRLVAVSVCSGSGLGGLTVAACWGVASAVTSEKRNPVAYSFSCSQRRRRTSVAS